MGCAGFFAEQHALISYNIVPGMRALAYMHLQVYSLLSGLGEH